jgi:pyridoxal phosphate enzyme (YggS family)
VASGILEPSEASRRLDAVRARIEGAARRAGRPATEIHLVAVAKTHPPEHVLALAAAGQLVFGENRVQEASAKIAAVADRWKGPPLAWRLVGHLQRNKVRPALQVFDAVDSVDSLRLLEALAAEVRARGKRLPVLLEFNCSGEEAKSGFAPADAEEVAERLAAVEDVLAILGLMTIGPLDPDPEAARPVFRRLRALREDMERRLGRALPHLSMGMSGDLEVAVEEGATMVRVGTALFGSRP